MEKPTRWISYKGESAYTKGALGFLRAEYTNASLKERRAIERRELGYCLTPDPRPPKKRRRCREAEILLR